MAMAEMSKTNADWKGFRECAEEAVKKLRIDNGEWRMENWKKL
jgi:hypothetical protein